MFAFHNKFIPCATRSACLASVRFADGSAWLPRSAPAKKNRANSSFSALIRARFCELLSPRLGAGDSDLFLMGLLSLMDVIMEIPMAQILESVPVDQETKAVLLGGASHLRPLYQLMLAQESGEWEQTAELATKLGLQEGDVGEAYFQAVVWARGVNTP